MGRVTGRHGAETPGPGLMKREGPIEQGFRVTNRGVELQRFLERRRVTNRLLRTAAFQVLSGCLQQDEALVQDLGSWGHQHLADALHVAARASKLFLER
jgi:hypothetical protein